MTAVGSWQKIDEALSQEFSTLPELIRLHAAERPNHVALIEGDSQLTYAELDALIDRAAAALQRDGVKQNDVVALCGVNTIPFAVTFIAALRVGAAAAPLAPSATAEALAKMIDNCGANIVFADVTGNGAAAAGLTSNRVAGVSLDGEPPFVSFEQWLAPVGARPQPVQADPKSVFNIIYSSGTTGTPKGIIHTNSMRWWQFSRSALTTYRPDTVTIVSTPLYSNTTLVSFLPAIAGGGTTVLMRKFNTVGFLELSQKHRVTHAMLVPVQYRRLMEEPTFDQYDLSSFRMKFCTSAPFAASLKADVLKRWPGGLVEFYGMTEGGGSCMLRAHEFPNKLHTVGQPMEGHDIRIIDEDGNELPRGQVGEIVGSSPFIMPGYNKEPEKTAQTFWYDSTGKRFVRTGDIGRFDEDGFLIIMDRAKDCIISGGFNVYPSDLEAVVVQHPAVAEVAVVGVPSEQWGETPIAVVTLKPGETVEPEALREWANARLGKTQRISAVFITDAFPRNDIGKISKRHLRDQYAKTVAARQTA